MSYELLYEFIAELWCEPGTTDGYRFNIPLALSDALNQMLITTPVIACAQVDGKEWHHQLQADPSSSVYVLPVPADLLTQLALTTGCEYRIQLKLYPCL